jgi:LuxR family maltose regulon positive regulatory protein
LHPEYVSRPRVERHLRAAVERTPLTLLHAPLGSGKTAAAATAFDDLPETVWMEAHPWHAGAFVAELVDAVRNVRPEFGRMTLGALEAGAPVAHVAATFARELTHIDAPLLLVLDNVHVFEEATDFSRFVDTAVAALPAGVGILAMGRSLPDLALGKTFALGKAQILPSEFLAFDAQDVGALARHFGRDVDDAEIASILQTTEGWAAGVSLALTAQRMFLTRELLSGLDRRDVAFLEQIAVFETIDVDMLERSDEFADARERVAHLRRNGGLLTDIGKERYRLHPVLRQLAEDALENKGDLAGAHRAAAVAYARAGEIGAALFHAEKGRDPDTVAQLLRNHALAAIATGDRRRLRTLANTIDPDSKDASVRWYVDGLLEKARGSAETRAFFTRASDTADRSGDATTAFAARAQIIELDIGHTLHIDEMALAELTQRADTAGLPAMVTARVLRGWSRAVSHDFAGALAELSLVPALADPATRFNTDILKAYADTALGEVERAQETLDALTRLLENDDRIVLQTLTLVWFARLALLWGNTVVASDVAAQAERLASALDLRAEEAALYVALAEIATHQGDVAASVRYAERARSRADRAWYAGDVARVRAFAEIALARAAFLGHDNAIACELVERAVAGGGFPPVQRAVALTESAFYTLLSDATASARPIAAAREAVASATPLDAADAVALATADDLLSFLDAANGVVHEPGLRGCEPFEKLLERRRGLVTLGHAGVAVGSARRGSTESSVPFDTALEVLVRDGPRFEARLARAYASTFLKPKPSSTTVAFSVDLTARELEILELLVEGLTNKEIAQRLVVSPRTIETHVERVLGKLEVGSRSRAIAKALRLGIVKLV